MEVAMDNNRKDCLAPEPSARPIIFQNCAVLDTLRGALLPGHHVLIEGDSIREVSDRPIQLAGAVVYDLGGRTLMPGLCDAHVHVTAIEPDLSRLDELPPSYITARAINVLNSMLRRGFTTVRDAAGADQGLARAVREGVCTGPRLLCSGRALSQTGGHGDARSPGEASASTCLPPQWSLSRICDGVDEVRRAARDELRKGANQIKIMVSGGVASPADRVANNQFSLDEIRAIVAEAEAVDTYVMAHAYTARSIRRALECGVRSIEHGNLIDGETLDLLLDKGAFLVPTLTIYEMLYREGASAGIPQVALDKLGDLREKSLEALEMAMGKGVKVAFGTDLFGPFYGQQTLEFTLRQAVCTAAEMIHSATAVCAELFNMTGRIGVVAPGAYADLLAIDGDPLQDAGLLQEEGRYMSIIMKEGQFVVNRLETVP
jgi:imidazolonepropionase-like amidohydrolase